MKQESEKQGEAAGKACWLAPLPRVYLPVLCGYVLALGRRPQEVQAEKGEVHSPRDAAGKRGARRSKTRPRQLRRARALIARSGRPDEGFHMVDGGCMRQAPLDADAAAPCRLMLPSQPRVRLAPMQPHQLPDGHRVCVLTRQRGIVVER